MFWSQLCRPPSLERSQTSSAGNEKHKLKLNDKFSIKDLIPISVFPFFCRQHLPFEEVWRPKKPKPKSPRTLLLKICPRPILKKLNTKRKWCTKYKAYTKIDFLSQL